VPIRALLATVLLVAAGPAAAAERAYLCPQRTSAKAEAGLPTGWWRGERSEALGEAKGGDAGRLAEIWVVAGRKGEERAEAPAILKPDDPDGSYDLSQETDGVLVACLYRGSRVYYATELPAGVRTCRAQTRFDAKRSLLIGNRVVCR
jgi:hypothetical protein